jgi:hypothetical protein
MVEIAPKPAGLFTRFVTRSRARNIGKEFEVISSRGSIRTESSESQQGANALLTRN